VEQFWLIRDRRRSGPFSEADIMRAYYAGELKATDRLWAEGVPAPVTVVDAFAQLGGREPVGNIDLTLVDFDEPRTARLSRAADASPYRPPLAAVEDRSWGEVKYAGFWVRYAASMIDAVILGLLGALVGFVLSLGLQVVGVRSEGAVVLNAVAGLTIGWLYYALGESSLVRATWGKRALHLQVLTADGLDRISFLRASGRLLARYVSILVFMIGYLMQPFNARKRALHDFLCGTVVVIARPYSRLLVAVCIVLGLAVPIAGAVIAVLAVQEQLTLHGGDQVHSRR
jgi:uncharacterized RDD family membrane protein YckC